MKNKKIESRVCSQTAILILERKKMWFVSTTSFPPTWSEDPQGFLDPSVKLKGNLKAKIRIAEEKCNINLKY